MEMGSLMAGQAAALVCKIEPAERILAEIVSEASDIIRKTSILSES